MTTAYASTTTLAAIRAASPCEDGWRKLLGSLGKTGADDEPLDLLMVLDSNGLDDALWVLSCAMPDDRLARHFQAWCAEQVLHLFEAERPGTEILHPVAVVIFSGLISSTLLDTFLTPAMFWLFGRRDAERLLDDKNAEVF